jgi:hypothetical protein
MKKRITSRHVDIVLSHDISKYLKDIVSKVNYARTKPAEFSTGLIIQIPEYLAPSERIRINTAQKKFMGRAN